MRVSPTVKASETDIAYAAGFFDGEGTATIQTTGRLHGLAWTRRKRNLKAMATVTQSDLRPLTWLQARYGGKIRIKKQQKPHHKPCWELMLSGHQLDVFLTDIRPMLIIKSDVVDAVLEFRKTVHGNSGRVLPEHVHRQREACSARVLELNRRGINTRSA